MHRLENRELRVHVLDPVVHAARLGPRYCWGGYVWQVEDRMAGPLLTGPEWPQLAPSAFNGQGLPESFRHRTLDGRPLTWQGEVGLAVGAGELRRDPRGNVELTRPCRWEMTSHAQRLRFATRHEAAGFQYELVREVELAHREVHSSTFLTNTSSVERLALEWFAHPFFPLVDGVARAEVPAGTTLGENAGFVLTGRVLTQTRRFAAPDEGHMDRGLRLPTGCPLLATLAHPALTHVAVETRFAPDSCVIWGNDRTFSFEPYLVLDLAPGETRGWSMSYRFGVCSGRSAPSLQPPGSALQ